VRPDMREFPKIQLRDRICAHHCSPSVAAFVVMATPSAYRAGGDGLDEHVSLREEGRTVVHIGDSVHFLREVRVQEAASHSSLRLRHQPTSSYGLYILPIVLI
jgi:hypothetical protein